jgi:septal ring factor EnvC (AmiA/AmiB activator)
LDGTALTLCRSNQQTLQLQQQLEQQLQEQKERQNQLDKQQREVQQQLETMRLQNETLRKQLEREAVTRPASPVAAAAAASTRSADLKSWKAENPWYGTDYARTQFATRYMKRLEKEQPDLVGRELLDAVSAKVNETFPVKR